MQSRFQPKCVSGFGFSVVVQRRVLEVLLEAESALPGAEIWTERRRLISLSTGARIDVVVGRQGGLLDPEVVED
jgi:hypothetical protein